MDKETFLAQRKIGEEDLAARQSQQMEAPLNQFVSQERLLRARQVSDPIPFYYWCSKPKTTHWLSQMWTGRDTPWSRPCSKMCMMPAMRNAFKTTIWLSCQSRRASASETGLPSSVISIQPWPGTFRMPRIESKTGWLTSISKLTVSWSQTFRCPSDDI